MGEVRPFRPRRSDHPVQDTLLTCQCGGRWFTAIVTFRSLPGGFHKPDGYRMVDDADQPAVSCIACGRHHLVM